MIDWREACPTLTIYPVCDQLDVSQCDQKDCISCGGSGPSDAEHAWITGFQGGNGHFVAIGPLSAMLDRWAL